MPADRRSAYLRTATTARISNRRAALRGSQTAGGQRTRRIKIEIIDADRQPNPK
jgi:hypothetical protein